MQIQNFFAQDVNGNIVPGATCTLYLAGTTSLATGLKDATGNPLSNPFNASSSGLAAFQAPNGTYDLNVTGGLLTNTITIQFIDVAQVSADAASASASAASAAASAAAASAVVISLTSDLANPSDPLKGAALIGRGTVAIASVADLLLAKQDTSQSYVVAAFRPGVYALETPVADVGGGSFYWAPNVLKSAHDGGRIVSPTVPWDGTQSTLAAFLAGTGETQPSGKGVFVKSVQGDVWIEEYGGIGDQSTDNSPSFQGAINFLQRKRSGGVLRAGLGNFYLSASGKNNRSSDPTLGRVSFRGTDENGTIFTCIGSQGFVEIQNNQTVGSDNSASYQLISDMTILKSGGPGAAAGILINLGAWPKMERLNIQGFDYGVYFQDVDHFYCEAVNIRFNNKGFYAQRAVPAGPSSTGPNNYTFNACSISNNGTYGIFIIGGACININDGSIEYNGHVIGATGFGVQLQDCGYEGGIGANFHGTYIEANNGIADIILKTQTTASGAVLGVKHIVNCDFHRNLTGANTNNILTLFGPAASVGLNTLDVRGSSFKSFGGYVPNTSTKNIAFGDSQPTPDNFFDSGTYYGDQVERPDFSQNLNRYYASISRTTDQSLANATWDKYLVDTVANNFMYTPSLTSNSVTIPSTALYTVSATISFAGNTTGIRGVRFKLGTNIVASTNISAAADNTVTLTMTRRINVGAVLSFEVYQSSGAALAVQGTSTGNSIICVTKEVGQ